jgi:hypothetical protein
MDMERTLLVKNEVFVFNIPPRTSAKGYRAANWKLDAPDWTGRLRCIEKGGQCEIRLEDKSSGQLFAACPVEAYPGVAVEPVTDSSRYFVICVQDSGRKAFIGIGFADRSDSFDLNVTLQDHFKQLKKEHFFEQEAATEATKPNLDLAFKEGQTIRINIPSKAAGAATARPKAQKSLGGILPPPPGNNSTRLPTSVSGGNLAMAASAPAASGNAVADLLGDFGAPAQQLPSAVSAQQLPSSVPAQQLPAAAPSNSNPSQSQQFADFDDWGDFAAPAKPSTQSVGLGNWEQF